MHSFDQVAEAPRFQHAVRERARVGALSIGVLEMHFTPQLIEGLPADYTSLALINAPTRIKHRYPDIERPTQDFTSGDLILRPPDLPYESQVFNPLDVSVFAIETEVVRTATTDFNANVGEVFARLDMRPFRSPVVSSLSRRLADCAGTPGDHLYADSLSFALIHELWRMAQGNLHPSESAPGALTTRQMREIDEAISSTAGDTSSLEDLAALTAMSMTAFSAAMKATTGQTPYQYVLSRRTAKARDLIETTALPLSQIAFRCGFSSQSHMTDVFRAKVGTTPGKLRKART